MDRASAHGLAVRVVYPPAQTLVIEYDAEGNRSERVVEGGLSLLGPGFLPKVPAESRPRAVPTGPFLRLEEATAYVRAGKKRLLRWVRRGLLPETIDPDGRRFFRREDLDAVMGSGPAPVALVSSAAHLQTTKTPPRESSWLRPTQPRTRPRHPTKGAEHGEPGPAER